MAPWLAIVVGVAVLLAAGLRVHRYSPRHITVRLTLAGRGVYFSRTPDATWWKLRLRRHPRGSCWPGSGDEPPDIGVREPRRPRGPGPAATARIDLPT